ncbi:MAG TPA: hypothetical protein VMP00_15450 [Burkholderiales bacterium]|nr:hypothetical protein [Burkholderiales bacterium]
MKHLKSIVLATRIATAAGAAQARDMLPVETAGRNGAATEGTRIEVPSVGGNIEVANVQGRGSNFVQAKGFSGKSTLSATLAGVSEVLGRS